MITYLDSTDGIVPAQLSGFFDGWPNPPSPETHRRMLQGSRWAVLALDQESGRVVGFITAISDGMLAAYIPFLEVLPEYRRQGIGSQLVRRILALIGDIYMVDLICDADVRPFYERLGMTPATGMMLRNYACQSGRP